jgi:hypothetical protein
MVVEARMEAVVVEVAADGVAAVTVVASVVDRGTLRANVQIIVEVAVEVAVMETITEAVVVVVVVVAVAAAEDIIVANGRIEEDGRKNIFWYTIIFTKVILFLVCVVVILVLTFQSALFINPTQISLSCRENWTLAIADRLGTTRRS